jgi:hypothetical protein
MKHVFVSYAREDARFAGELTRRLRATRRTPWQDLRNLIGGDDWRVTIDDALRNADVLLVVMSPGATKSQYVTYEWAFALGAGVRVIPVLHKRTKLHPRLSLLQYIDFAAGNGTPWVDLWKALPPPSRSDGQHEPEIVARFNLINGKPQIDRGYYIILITVVQVLRGARAVTYELHDETLAQRKWTTKAAGSDFESQMWSNGDILVTAAIHSQKSIRIASTLYEALRRGHGTSPNENIRRALHKLKEYKGGKRGA